MSTIYRWAQLTIIAAAGQDPTHGLPGVEPYRRSPNHGYHETVGSVCLSALPWTILHGSAYFDDIRNTVWASRAWTFQEANFSRRRLLFTESQVIFSCNTSTRCEWGRELGNDHREFEGLQWCGAREPLRVGSPLRGACDIIEKYCVLRMSHDSDALNAIASTLDFIQTSDEYHIWAVPFSVCESSSDKRQEAISTRSDPAVLLDSSDFQKVQIYLSWRHMRPRHRREGFPSWSPLGWSSGYIEYLDTYQGCVFVDTPHDKRSLSTILQSTKLNPVGMAQHISLLLRTRFVSVCKHNINISNGGNSEYGILLPLGQGLSRMSQVFWDEPVEIECEMKIAIISSSNRYGVDFVLLQAHDGYYERIGWSFILPDTPRNWAEYDLSLCLTDDKFELMALSVDGKIEPPDEERLRAAFGDIDELCHGYGREEFQEELIVFG